MMSSFNEMMLFYARFMRVAAILPFEGHNYTHLATRVLLTFFLIASVIQWSSFLLYVINQGTRTIDGICETVAVIGMCLRYYLLLWHRQDLADLLTHCQGIWKDLCENDEDCRNLVRHFESKVRLLFKCLIGSFYAGYILYDINAVSLTLKSVRNSNGTDIKHYLPYKWYAEGAEDYWPGYLINFLITQIVGVFTSVFTTSVDTAAPLLAMIGAGYLRAFQLKLNRAYVNALENNDDNCVDSEFIDCARLHQRILNYCAAIDNITRSLFFVQLLTTTYNLSLMMIKLAGTDPDRYKYAPILLLNLGQQFLCQWAPDHLASESEAVATAAYSVSVPWMRRRIGKMIVIMIIRAQQPVQMTAAGVVNLSLENFGMTLKGAVSFFTVLRSFTT